MNEECTSALQQLAALAGTDIKNLCIKGDVVFLLNGNELIGTVCQIGTPYWNSSKATAELLNRLRTR